jgi:hypothetical protein
MRKTIKTQSWLFASLALICLATGAMADTTVSMELIGPPPGPSLGGIYTDPYTAIIGAPGQTKQTINGVVTSVMCDDFTTDNSTVTPPWQATLTSLYSILNESSVNKVVKFDNGAGSTVAQQQADYSVAAYLAIEITNTDQSTAGGQETAGQLSYALWNVFDSSDPSGPLVGGFLTGTDLTMAQDDFTQAQQAVASGWTPGSYTVNIYTPSYPSTLDAAQEFLTVSAPEASTPVLLAADLLGLLFLWRFLRKRASRSV